jgi:PAS domain S-box-containing protein
MFVEAHSEQLKEVADVLMVDDRPDNLLALEAVLARPEYRLVHAGSGRDALKYLLDHECAVILLDVQMPQMDGYETAHMIREREISRQIPIIFISAVSREQEDIAKGYRAGALDYLPKPFDPDHLRSKVSTLVEMYNRNRDFRKSAEGERQALVARELIAQRETALQRDQYYSLFMQAPVPICMTRGAEHRFEFANEAYRKLTGDRQLKGLTAREAFPELKGQGYFERLDEVYRESQTYIGKSVVFRHRLVNHEHRLLILDLIFKPWLDARGKVEGIISFVCDVTEQAQARRKLERLASDLTGAVRIRDSFLSIASHELKTPLTSLKLQTEMAGLLLESPQVQGAEKALKLIHEMDFQIDRLTQLMEKMLSAEELNAGKSLEPWIERLNLKALISQVLVDFTPEATASGVSITFRAESGVWCLCDRTQIEILVLSLLSNAIKYGDRKPVTITLSSHAGIARLVVQDQGIGIDRKDHERIFERFERAVAARNISGFGLGLYVARAIAAQHHGTIEVESELGAGASFIVKLPTE